MSVKIELRNYLQSRYDALKNSAKTGENVDQALLEVNNIAAKFEIKLKVPTK